MDYRGLKCVRIVINNRLSLMNNLCDRFAASRIFTRVDCQTGCSLIQIKSGVEWKTASHTSYRYYESSVMPFGLANTPVTFQDMMNVILQYLSDHGAVVYIDIFSSIKNTKKCMRNCQQKLFVNNRKTTWL
jgi:hypothetical protein